MTRSNSKHVLCSEIRQDILNLNDRKNSLKVICPLGCRGVWVRFLAGAFPDRLQAPVTIRTTFTRVKVAGSPDDHFHLGSAVPLQPFHVFMTGCLINHRNIFTLFSVNFSVNTISMYGFSMLDSCVCLELCRHTGQYLLRLVHMHIADPSGTGFQRVI